MNDATESAIRTEVRAWLEDNWDPNLGLHEWRQRLVDSGWGCPAWPRQWYGRGLPPALAAAAEDEMQKVGAIGVAQFGVRLLAGATLLEHGNDDQKRLLPGILTGQDTWCQLFSEPGSGSDLAGLTTRAVQDEQGRWTINGQKVWTTSAQHADYGLLLARTDWDQPKHRGLSYFILDMRQAGVEVRPLRQMNGYASFNEVFITDAKAGADRLLGQPGDGWKIALTTLAHERRLADSMRSWGRLRTGQGKIYEELKAEYASVMEPYKWYPQRAGRVDLLMPQARATGRIDDPVVRQQMARALMLERAAEWTAQRARAARAMGQPPGPEGSLGKLAASEVARASATAHASIGGAEALLSGDDGPEQGLIAEILISVPACSIAGGTDQIQRNIIGERVLGLPKEPGDHANLPFRDVRRNTQG